MNNSIGIYAALFDGQQIVSFNSVVVLAGAELLAGICKTFFGYSESISRKEKVEVIVFILLVIEPIFECCGRNSNNWKIWKMRWLHPGRIHHSANIGYLFVDFRSIRNFSVLEKKTGEQLVFKG